jgi:hypothetical protein
MPKNVRECPACHLVQFERPACRRCHRPMPPSPTPEVETVVVEKVVERVVERLVLVSESGATLPCGVVFGDELPKFHELEDALIRVALQRCSDNASEAARMIGLGKTTIYRRMSAMRSMEPGVGVE